MGLGGETAEFKYVSSCKTFTGKVKINKSQTRLIQNITAVSHIGLPPSFAYVL